MKKKLLYILILLVLPNVTFGCSCVFESLEEIFNERDLVFKGKVIFFEKLKEVNEDEDIVEYNYYTFSIEQVFKAQEKIDTVVIKVMTGSTCSVYYELGQEEIIYAYYNKGNYETDLCSVPEERPDIQTEIKLLKELQKSNTCETFAKIIGFDATKCGCCWGWIIEIEIKKYLTNELPGLKISQNRELIYPIEIKINYDLENDRCNNRIIITCLEKVK